MRKRPFRGMWLLPGIFSHLDRLFGRVLLLVGARLLLVHLVERRDNADFGGFAGFAVAGRTALPGARRLHRLISGLVGWLVGSRALGLGFGRVLTQRFGFDRG